MIKTNSINKDFRDEKGKNLNNKKENHLKKFNFSIQSYPNSYTEESICSRQIGKNDIYLDTSQNLDKPSKRRSRESIDSISLENFLDKDFLHLINSPSIVKLYNIETYKFEKLI